MENIRGFFLGWQPITGLSPQNCLSGASYGVSAARWKHFRLLLHLAITGQILVTAGILLLNPLQTQETVDNDIRGPVRPKTCNWNVL